MSSRHPLIPPAVAVVGVAVVGFIATSLIDHGNPALVAALALAGGLVEIAATTPAQLGLTRAADRSPVVVPLDGPAPMPIELVLDTTPPIDAARFVSDRPPGELPCDRCGLYFRDDDTDPAAAGTHRQSPPRPLHA